MKIRKLLHTYLSIIFLFHIYGCVVTPEAIKYAEEKASEPKIYKKIINIHPIAFREKGNIKLCVTLSCELEDCKEENFLVILPVESLSSGETTPEKMDLLIDQNSNNPYLPVYWFPIEKPSKDCSDIATMETGSEIYVKKLYIPTNEWKYLYEGIPKDKDEIYTILNSYNEGELSDGSVYALNIGKLNNLTTKEIILIYFPKKEKKPTVTAMGVIGGYHDPSTNAGYALVPLAIVADIAIVALVIALAALIAVADWERSWN